MFREPKFGVFRDQTFAFQGVTLPPRVSTPLALGPKKSVPFFPRPTMDRTQEPMTEKVTTPYYASPQVHEGL